MEPRRVPAMQKGFVAVAPILIGVVPFGVIAGVASVEAGLGVAGAVGLSTIVFAGASQLAMIDLIARDAALPVIVFTALVINSRMMMYSASLVTHWSQVPRPRRAMLSYLITDQAYAISVARYEMVEEPLGDRIGYYLGAALGLWSTWQISTLVGVAVGTGVPPSWQLDFAVPLVFLALLVPAVTSRPRLVAALVGGVAAVAAAGLPYNLGLVAGALGGIAAGTLAELAREGGAQ